MAVVKDLRTIDYILERLKKLPNIVEVTGYDVTALEIFQRGLRRAIKRYEKESERVRRHYIRH